LRVNHAVTQPGGFSSDATLPGSVSDISGSDSACSGGRATGLGSSDRDVVGLEGVLGDNGGGAVEGVVGGVIIVRTSMTGCGRGVTGGGASGSWGVSRSVMANGASGVEPV